MAQHSMPPKAWAGYFAMTGGAEGKNGLTYSLPCEHTSAELRVRASPGGLESAMIILTRDKCFPVKGRCESRIAPRLQTMPAHTFPTNSLRARPLVLSSNSYCACLRLAAVKRARSPDVLADARHVGRAASSPATLKEPALLMISSARQ